MTPNGENRLDRMERLLEAYIQHNERAHENFEREHKDLLTAQVVLTDRMNTLSAHMDVLSLKVAEITDKLNALISVVDDIIRGRRQG